MEIRFALSCRMDVGSCNCCTTSVTNELTLSATGYRSVALKPLVLEVASDSKAVDERVKGLPIALIDNS